MKLKRKNKNKKMLIIVLVLAIATLLILFARKNSTLQKIEKNQYELEIAGITVDTSKVLTNEPNVPQLGAGMIPIKNVNGMWQITTVEDKNWYDYASGKLPTIMLSDRILFIRIAKRYDKSRSSKWNTTSASR